MENFNVFGLLNDTGISWNLSLLYEHFLPFDVACISCIPLSIYRQVDKRIQHFTKNGLYSVKSGYHLLVQLDSNLAQFVVPSPWKKVWNLYIPPMVKNFFWRALIDILPSKMSLVAKGIDIALGCRLCGVEEDIKYTFVR